MIHTFFFSYLRLTYTGLSCTQQNGATQFNANEAPATYRSRPPPGALRALEAENKFDIELYSRALKYVSKKIEPFEENNKDVFL